MRAWILFSFSFSFLLIVSSNKLNKLGIGSQVPCNDSCGGKYSPGNHRFDPSPPPGTLTDTSGTDTNVHYPSYLPQPFSATNLSTSWTNDEPSIGSINFTDGSRIRVILNKDRFACGFFCNGNCTSYVFAIVIKLLYSQPYIFGPEGNPTVIWSANRDNPVREGATLNFTAAGRLVLQDVDGSIVWTTITAGKYVSGMNLTDNGNLMLFDDHKSMVWQSFDTPTDSLVAGQKLFQEQMLIPSVSSTNLMAQKDSYYLQLTDKGLFAYVESSPPQVYYENLFEGINTNNETIYVDLSNGSLCYFISSNKLLQSEPIYCTGINIPEGFQLQYIKLMPDGHLKAFSGTEVADLTTIGQYGECTYPLVCGRNAICSDNKQCSCPGKGYFTAVDDLQLNKGCSPVAPLTCHATQHQHFIEFQNITYFAFNGNMENVDVETCKQACLNNCSCKAAIFLYRGSNSSNGSCNLPDELFTMTNLGRNGYDQVLASAFIKVQDRGKNKGTIILSSTIGSFVLLIVVVAFTKFIIQKKKVDDEMKEEYLDPVPGLPTRFSYIQLKTATGDFSKKIGEGGFGSVFQGTLEDGSGIAVKCIQGPMHVKKSFLAEVESIGSIHHVNLVRLRGFSAWKSERLLVYDFMSNGSLDKWIYNADREHQLGWKCREKIILDIAKGLAYLHEDCRQKIIHLDIKPQNILLDEDFNAKLSDFGLSKLIDRDQGQVMTGTRGTPGYMAPECFNSIITEKADVYSFGIVLLEVLCRRKKFDRSQPEESWNLLCVFQRSWEEGTLLDMVDRSSEDMQVHCNEVMEMMKLASWCLQTAFTKRPSMSTVMKVLEGVMNVQSNLDYNFSEPRVPKTAIEQQKSSTLMFPSLLSGPR